MGLPCISMAAVCYRSGCAETLIMVPVPGNDQLCIFLASKGRKAEIV